MVHCDWDGQHGSLAVHLHPEDCLVSSGVAATPVVRRTNAKKRMLRWGIENSECLPFGLLIGPVMYTVVSKPRNQCMRRIEEEIPGTWKTHTHHCKHSISVKGNTLLTAMFP